MSTAVVEASTEPRRQRNGQSFAGRVPASTTLFELFAALHTVVPPDDDELVVATVVHWLRLGQLRWRGEPSEVRGSSEKEVRPWTGSSVTVVCPPTPPSLLKLFPDPVCIVSSKTVAGVLMWATGIKKAMFRHS